MTTDDTNNIFSTKMLTQDERTVPYLPIELIYHSPTNCLTPSNLLSLKTLEDAITALPGYTSICQKDNGGNCVKPKSILRFFDGTYSSVNGVFASDPTFAHISTILQAAYALNGGSLASTANLRVVLDYNLGSGLVKSHNRSFKEVQRYCADILPMQTSTMCMSPLPHAAPSSSSASLCLGTAL